MFDGQLVDIYNAQQQPMRVAVAVFSAIIQAMYLDCSVLLGYFVRYFWDILFGTFGVLRSVFLGVFCSALLG